jgi:hypothetical protein
MTKTTATVALLLSFTLIVLPGVSKDKKREWQTGKLISVEQGTEAGAGVITGKTTTTPLVIPTTYKTWTYTVETNTMVYGFSAIGKGWHERPHNLTIGKEVKFALGDKEDVWVLDEDGKEFKASVTKKAAKPAPKS